MNHYSFVFTAKEAAKMEQKKRQVYTFSPSLHSEQLPAEEILKKHNIQILINHKRLKPFPTSLINLC